MKSTEKMWMEYLKINPDATSYDAWAFGGLTPEDTDLLAKLVLEGTKTATCSAYDFYLNENAPLPLIGKFNIILNSLNEPVCITKTFKVSVEKFKDVSEEHARKEGEGDISLEYWRTVHEQFFKNELKEIHKEFSDEILVVCEEFECVYPVK